MLAQPFLDFIAPEAVRFRLQVRAVDMCFNVLHLPECVNNTILLNLAYRSIAVEAVTPMRVTMNGLALRMCASGRFTMTSLCCSKTEPAVGDLMAGVQRKCI